MKKLNHIVLFQFKDSVTEEQIKHANLEFAALKDKISAIHSFEMGTNNSPEGIAHGYTHGYVLTFLSEADRDVYLMHPEHKAFQGIVDPLLAMPLAFDFWANL
ncbi:Dabb family protein [Marinomonas communis]|uniref:Stress responsive alpha/beta barrel protein n=1 Tax=Marinomonas communis TaxID=28254 RepID=A0A4V3DFM5_9GAMM|nr:Dabb family protein [Marinomonas communis]TDR05880.1 stress responsive alpha/beta barrel protein [Marinomonas communis]